jgi:hypothetical protein
MSEELKVEQKPAALSEEQNAMLHYEHYVNQFVTALKNFEGSKQQVIRAWANGLVSPLNKEELHFSYPEEQQLFNLYTEANSAKLILMVHGLIKAGVLQQLKPLMEAADFTPSEKQLAELSATENKVEGNTGEIVNE